MALGVGLEINDEKPSGDRVRAVVEELLEQARRTAAAVAVHFARGYGHVQLVPQDLVTGSVDAAQVPGGENAFEDGHDVVDLVDRMTLYAFATLYRDGVKD